MFGKLLKYDFRAMWKQFAFIWPAALVLAVVNRFTLDGLGSSSSVGETTAGVAMLVYVAILIAMFIIAVIFTIQRFYTGLLGDEGYLIHTLPVKPWQLVASKLLCAVAATAVNVAVAILSMLLILPWDSGDLREVFQVLQYLCSHWSMESAQVIIAMLEFILFMLVSFAVGYLHVYLAMALGHLFNKNRVAMSVVAFIALQVVVSILGNMILPPINELISPLVHNFQGLEGFHAAMWFGIAIELAASAVYFAGTNYILHHRLNLE